jgi:hypothetical protein
MEIAAEVVRRVHGSQRWLQSNPRKSAQCLATAPSGLSATLPKRIGDSPDAMEEWRVSRPEPYKRKISGADEARACEQRAARAPTELW